MAVEDDFTESGVRGVLPTYARTYTRAVEFAVG